MANKTSIEWVRGADGSEGYSWNALRAERKVGGRPGITANHCEHVNEACRFCYAESLNARLGGLPFKPGHRKDYRFFVDEEKLTAPLRMRKPTRIFVESMSDAFGDWWPDEFIDKLYAVKALCPQHTFINLSKRPERRRKYLDRENTPFDVATEALTIGRNLPDSYPGWSRDYWKPSVIRGCTQPAIWPLPNVIEGTSVSCQSEADEFVPILLQTKAAVRCVSAEPLLGGIDFTAIPWDDGSNVNALRGLDWIIVGGESGTRARPMNPEWARSIREQCTAAGVAFFFKQFGAWAPTANVGFGARDAIPTHVFRAEGSIKTFGGPIPLGIEMRKVGKKAAGRLLDGVQHDGFPKERANEPT